MGLREPQNASCKSTFAPRNLRSACCGTFHRDEGSTIKIAVQSSVADEKTIKMSCILLSRLKNKINMSVIESR
jgi:hypothetical protein